MIQRDYQLKAEAAIHAEWQGGATSTLLVMPTGTGKTVVISHVIKTLLPKRAIVIAHREELIWQARDKIKNITGVRVEVEMGGYKAEVDRDLLQPTSPVIVSTVQTLTSGGDGGGRLSKFNPEDFGLVVIDECFPRGTMIDGVPIEKIKIGDCVKTHKGIGRVEFLFKKKTDSICRVSFSDGNKIICTPNHPVWTLDGFKPAISLTDSDMVLSIMPYEKMHHLRSGSRKETLQKERVPLGIFKANNSEIVQTSRWSNYSIQKNKRNVPTGSSSKSFVESEDNGTLPDNSRRKWARTNHPSKTFSDRAWMGNGDSNSNKKETQNRVSNLLQIGRRESGSENCNRRGWQFAQSFIPSRTGQKEGCAFNFIGVESVEIFKQGSGNEFEQLCPNGEVYNLEVSNGNTYFAEGILVHNCHHATSPSYRRVIEHFKRNKKLKFLGVTATPDRSDEEALGQIFDTVAFDYEILDAIRDGWLVPVEQQFVSTVFDGFENIRTTAGDLNGADLAAVMESEKSLHSIAHPTIEIVGNRRGIGFASSVEQARLLSEIFNRHRPGMSNWVSGKTDKEDRRKIVSDFAAGRVQWLWNCGVFTEGFDDAGVEVISMARPTKSRSLYAQMAGRATRPHGSIATRLNNMPIPELRKMAIQRSPKKSALIIDFVGNSGRHKLMTTADVLGGNVSDEAMEAAVTTARTTGRPMRMAELLEEEEKRVEEKKKRELQEQARKARLVARASYKKQSVDPFDILQIKPVKERGWDRGKAFSEGQRGFLRNLGADPDSLNYANGKRLMDEIGNRRKNGLCTLPQAKQLKRFGFNTDMTFDQARKTIDAIAGNGWKRPKDFVVPAPENKPQQETPPRRPIEDDDIPF